ncbi:MULE domain-containing protein, partial [Aphis craccivora]
IQQNGLSNDYKDKNSDIRRWLVQCYGLPFLSPESVSEYFVNYLMKSKPDDERVTRFADYLVDIYISKEQGRTGTTFRPGK